MSQVVSLHVCEILRQFRMVKSIVHAVVEDVKGKGTADDTIGDCFWKEGVSESGEWCFEREEECRRHDESEPVHWEVMVNTVKKEMEE